MIIEYVRIPVIITCLLAMMPVGWTQGDTVESLIADAVRPLPGPLQAGATVVSYDDEFNRTVLREGTNGIVCNADSPKPGYSVVCQHEDVEAYWLRGAQLVAGGMSRKERDKIRNEEMEQGKLPRLDPGLARYGLGGASRESATPIMVVMLPYATTESTGLSSVPDNYRPWLMEAGTPSAHIMIPGK